MADISNVRLTAAGWRAVRCVRDGKPEYAATGGVTNAVNQGVLRRSEDGIELTDLGREVADHVWGGV